MHKNCRDFRTQLRAIVKREEITHAELARRSGLSLSSINKYLSGERPDPTRSAVIRIAEALSVPVQDLM